jgi:hypothetical protein
MEKIFNHPISNYRVECFSYLHGTRTFDGQDWFVKGDNKTFTKYPPTEGTCQVICEGQLIFAGDWSKLPASFRVKLHTWKKYGGIEKIFLAAAARKEKNRLQEEEEAESNWQEERAFHGRSI